MSDNYFRRATEDTLCQNIDAKYLDNMTCSIVGFKWFVKQMGILILEPEIHESSLKSKMKGSK